MFKGEYSHSLDEKGRFVCPLKFRGNLGEHPVMTRGIDGCIWLFPEDAWKKMEKRLLEGDELDLNIIKLRRWMVGTAADISLDNANRIGIPQALRDYAGIKDKVVVIGQVSRIEIWDAERYKEWTQKISPEEIAEAARLTRPNSNQQSSE